MGQDSLWGVLARAAMVVFATLGFFLLALSMTTEADAPFERTSREWRDRDTRVEFAHLAPGLCTVKTWRGSLQVTPDVEWVYEGLCSAGGTLVRYDYCVRMARGEE